jgi:hypothetical protein
MSSQSLDINTPHRKTTVDGFLNKRSPFKCISQSVILLMTSPPMFSTMKVISFRVILEMGGGGGGGVSVPLSAGEDADEENWGGLVET